MAAITMAFLAEAKESEEVNNDVLKTLEEGHSGTKKSCVNYITTLQTLRTWRLEDLPKERDPIGCK
jgi:hypothetical protein